MALAPIPGPSATTATGGLASVGLWRLLAVAAPQLAALAVMFQTETDLGSRTGFLLSWGILNFFWIALLRRPALSGALSLTLVVVLVLLSRLKHDIVQMTANFVDLMVIDRDTAAFLFTIFPHLRWSVIAAAVVILPLMYALWWLDPFRIRRLPAVACALACLAAPASPRYRISSDTAFWNPIRWRTIISTCRWSTPATPPDGGPTSS
jgi:hypothetical protein